MKTGMATAIKTASSGATDSFESLVCHTSALKPRSIKLFN